MMAKSLLFNIKWNFSFQISSTVHFRSEKCSHKSTFFLLLFFKCEPSKLILTHHSLVQINPATKRWENETTVAVQSFELGLTPPWAQPLRKLPRLHKSFLSPSDTRCCNLHLSCRKDTKCRDFVRLSLVAITTLLFPVCARAILPMSRSSISDKKKQ